METFAADLDHSPGRFNLLEVNGADGRRRLRTQRVVAGGYVGSAFQRFPHRHRTAVYTVAGDRRDCDMVRQGELLGQAFDRVILYEDHYVRGRNPGEIMHRFRDGLVRVLRVEQIEEIFGAVKAIDAALSTLKPGDLLLLQADTIDETVDYVRRYLAENYTARETTYCEALATAAGSFACGQR